MKIRFLLDALLLLALTACHRPVETRHGTSLPPELTAIDTLMQTRPDSALTLLLEAPVDDPYYQLLLSEAFYKNDSVQLNRRELLDAMAYYDSVGCPLLAARCHYMNGVGFYETDSVVPACEEYLRALEIMEDHFDEKDLVGPKAKFMALTYTRLTDIFSDQYLHEQAIYFSKQSIIYYKRFAAEPWFIARMLEEIGTHYDIMGNCDSANYYYQKAEVSLKDTTCLLFRDIKTHLAYVSYETKKDTVFSPHQLYYLLNIAESEKEYLSRCLVLGEIYFQEKRLDSAEYYLTKVFESSDLIDFKILSAQHLLEICSSQGDTALNNEYSYYLSQQAHTSDARAYTHSRLARLCQSFEQNQNEWFHYKRQQIMKGRLGTAFILLSVAATASFVVLLTNRKRLKKQKEEAETQRIQHSALAVRLKQSNKKLREQLENNRNPNDGKTAGRDAHAESFLDEPICRLVLQRVHEGQFKSQMDYAVYKKHALTREQLLALRTAADYHFDRFTSRLTDAYPKLSDGDIDYCCLYLLGLSNSDLSALLQRAYTTVNERNNRLKNIFNTKKPLSITLQEIAEKKTTV